jgi:hypothetical protein
LQGYLKTLLQGYLQYTLLQGLPRVTQFLEAVLQELPEWRQSLNPFPVLTWPAFIAYLHQAVNPLAGDEHLKVSRAANFISLVAIYSAMYCSGESSYNSRVIFLATLSVLYRSFLTLNR